MVLIIFLGVNIIIISGFISLNILYVIKLLPHPVANSIYILLVSSNCFT